MSEAGYTINHAIDGWPVCKDGEAIPNNKAMLAELHQLQARCAELEMDNATLQRAFAQETLHREQCADEKAAVWRRCLELEAINLGLTKTLVEMEEEKAKLVEALERIASWPDGGNRTGQPHIKMFAAKTLAAHRKPGGEK